MHFTTTDTLEKKSVAWERPQVKKSDVSKKSYKYYPFGLQTNNSWTRENNSNNYLYNQGNELNQNSGWYETFFRGYDPALGRFLQVDPMSFSEQATYQYAANNPVYYTDPLGAFAGGRMVTQSRQTWDKFWNMFSYHAEYDYGSSGGSGSRKGSGDYWSDGWQNDDWVFGHGSETYRAGLVAGGTDVGGLIYIFDRDGQHKVEKDPITGEIGYWVGVKKPRFEKVELPDKRWVSLGISPAQQGPGDPPGTFWSAFGHVLGFFSGVGERVNVYGPDSPESKAMNESPGIDQAIANYYATGQRRFGYRFSPVWKDGKLTETEGWFEKHKQANNPITFTTGGYTVFITEMANGSLSLMVMNRMSVNSLFGHIGSYFGNSESVNYERAPSQTLQPFSNTYQYYLINRPRK
jgi:RHS repeat-associated protein